ncbi:MAG: long-chain fatty acid--CoA ligase [Deltaproteobacteria bacterium]|nr:long-chain fatty acid--CoA ligase [Deltaproteobacteria bacterium]
MGKNFKAWPKDWPKNLNYPEIPVYDFLDQAAARVPNRVAIIFGGMELTFSELKELSDRFATALAAMGVKKGDRVAIHLPNCTQFVIAYYGTLRLGAIFTPLSPLLAPNEAQYQLNDAGAETLISLDLIFPGIKEVVSQTKVKRIITTSIADCYNSIIAPLKPIGKIEVPDTIDMASLLKEYKPDVPKVSIDVKNDLAHLAYTGGTTGISKGVMLTHRNVVANVLQFGAWFNGNQFEMQDGVLNFVYPPGVDPKKDRITAPDQETALVVVPWFHAMGTIAYLNLNIIAGNTMIVFPRFDPREYIGAVAKYRATILGGAPQLYIPLVNLPDFESYDLSGIKLAGSGAAPLALSVLEKMLDTFSGVVCEAYGLTECTMGATANPPDRSSIRPGSIGIPVPDTECKIVDTVTGEELTPGSEGELCIQGPQVMKGYWNKPEETAKVLKEGWLFTGDVAKEDEDGYFYITDRIKDLIIYKGYNVYPREIEEVIFEHPTVQQCAVVGKPSPEGGEAPIAFVELKKGTQATKEEILDYTNSKIAHYKKVRDVIFLEQIPVSVAGKVLKKELRERLKQE